MKSIFGETIVIFFTILKLYLLKSKFCKYSLINLFAHHQAIKHWSGQTSKLKISSKAIIKISLKISKNSSFSCSKTFSSIFFIISLLAKLYFPLTIFIKSFIQKVSFLTHKIFQFLLTIIEVWVFPKSRITIFFLSENNQTNAYSVGIILTTSFFK